MSIGLFGNLANNAYNVARLLRKRGIDVRLILDPKDTFAFSQPMWEDSQIALENRSLMSSNTNWQFWLRKSRELDWHAPEWIENFGRNPHSITGVATTAFNDPAFALRLGLKTATSSKLLKFALGNLRTIKLLSDFDSLLVYGLGPVYASLADVPFVAIPYGGDIMIVPFQDHYLSRMQRVAYSRAREILVGDPDFVNSLVRLSLSDRWKYFPFPVDIEKYAPMDMKSKDFVTERLPAWVGRKHIFFMPSRQDFFWKGTQKALRAFSRLAHQRDDVALVTPSWGVNTGDAIQIVHESGIDGSVVFLPYALSKPLLIEFYRAAYVVLDQFVLGSYGTAMLEAMACGRAVITHVERNKYERFLEHPPPNLQAFSEQEILQQMQWVLENPGAHEAICKQSRDWVVAEHTTKPLDLLQNVIFRHC